MPKSRRGFSLLELLMAVGILAFCFVPVLTHSRATVQETEAAQEDVLARHFLIDLVERYKGASIDDLQYLPSTQPANITLGTDPVYIQKDALLSDAGRVLSELQGLSTVSGTGQAAYKDGAVAGLQKFVDLGSMIKLTRLVSYVPLDTTNPQKGGILTCTIAYQSRNGQMKTLTVSRVITRDPPAS